MADVQKENGYTAIANELLEAICGAGFTAMELKVIFTVIRHTYGYQKTESEISLGIIASFINHKDKASISKAVARLIQSNVIHLVKMNGQTRVLKVNKDYETWNLKGCQNDNCCQNNNSQNDNGTVVKMTMERLSKQQRILYKEKIKKDKEISQKNNGCENNNCLIKKPNPLDAFQEDFETLWKLYPKKRGKSGISKKAMKELQKAGFETVKKAIECYKEEIRKNHTDEQYILHGSTFFNGRWKDYISEVSEEDEPYANVGLHL